MEYGIRKDNGFIIYDIETKKVIVKYAPGSFDYAINFFKKRNYPPKSISGFSNKEKESLLELKAKEMK